MESSLAFEGDQGIGEKEPCPLNMYDFRRTSPVSRRRRGGGGEAGGEEGGETAIGGEGEEVREQRRIKARFEHSSAEFKKKLHCFFNFSCEF